MVKNNVSGLLSELYDENTFVKNIEYFIELDNYDIYSKSAKYTIEEIFSEKVVVEQIVSLYKKRYTP